MQPLPRRSFLGAAVGGAALVAAGSLPETGQAAPVAWDLSDLPFRQDDPRWGADLMWDRRRVVRAAHRFEGLPLRASRSLLRRFPEGNSIGNEGCQLTCLAMVLSLLDPSHRPAWDPAVLNEQAHRNWFYTLSGLSMTTLYADLVSDVSLGRVQLAVKEEYLPSVGPWPRIRPSSSALVRAYRGLPAAQRTSALLMIKLGTFDDTVASHYVLLHPEDNQGPDDDDPPVLDPAQPLQSTQPSWRLSDSAHRITKDPAIARAWRREGIQGDQLAGVWAFTRWERSAGRSSIAPLVEAWNQELNRG